MARILPSDVDNKIPVCNISDSNEFSTSYEDRRPHPVMDGHPNTDSTDESRLSAVAAGAGPAGQGTANSPEASLSAVAAGTIVDTGIISMDRYQGPILLSPST